MKCKYTFFITLQLFIILIIALLAFSCNENLPVYEMPQDVMSLEVSKVEQLNDHVAPPNRPQVHIVLVGENIFDEVFYDSVSIQGAMRIWWKRKPKRYRTLYLTEKNLTDRTLIRNGRMMLLPGQRFSLETYWDIKTDDGMWLVSEMDFSYAMRRYCDYNVICATPEDFVIEVSLKIFDRLGYVIAEPREFKYVGRACVCYSYPPCSNIGGEC